jgi:hypothetical protein
VGYLLMLRPILAVAAVGVGGYVLWQVLWGFLFPILGVVLGVVWTVLKIALIVLAAYWIYRLLVRNGNKKAEASS